MPGLPVGEWAPELAEAEIPQKARLLDGNIGLA
jgi:hypothetical protein